MDDSGLMKTTTLLLACLISGVANVAAQEAKTGENLGEVQAPPKPPKAPVQQTTPAEKPLGPKVSYGGFLTELARAEKKREFLSLRTPPDPKKDTEHLWYYPGTDKIQGSVLFSIKF